MQGDTFDAAYATRWMEEIAGPDDGRVARFRELVAEVQVVGS
jgi:hypothetical protein